MKSRLLKTATTTVVKLGKPSAATVYKYCDCITVRRVLNTALRQWSVSCVQQPLTHDMIDHSTGRTHYRTTSTVPLQLRAGPQAGSPTALGREGGRRWL